MSSLKARVITAGVAIPFIIALLILTEYFPWIMTIAIAILCVIMSFEILSVRKLQHNPVILISCILFAFVTPLIIATKYNFLAVYLFILLLCVTMIFMHSKVSLGDIAFTFFTLFIVVFGMSCILLLSNALQGCVAFSFVLCVGVPWLSDTGAYFAGVFLGKHKLCPKISPKKTIEGFVGGLIVGTLSALLIGFVFTLIYKDVEFSYVALLVMGFFGSLISVAGDLTFSLIKRYCDVKDYGSLFPGHGGMTDRFDSVVLVAPIMYFFCTTFNVITV